MFSKLDNRYIRDFDTMAQMQVMEILPQRDQRQYSPISKRNAFIQDEVSNSRGMCDDSCEVGVLETSALREIKDAKRGPFLGSEARNKRVGLKGSASAKSEFTKYRKRLIRREAFRRNTS